MGRTSIGPPAKSVRAALGVLIIKERLGASDEETVEQIRENPYLQYFLGFKSYSDEPPFHPTMFVHFRKRIGKKALCKIIEAVNKNALSSAKQPTRKKKKSSNDDQNGKSGGEKENQGKLLVDATCTQADITFPYSLDGKYYFA